MEDCVSEKRKVSDSISDARYVFQSNGIRRTPKMAFGQNRELLAFNFHFLPCVGCLLYILFYFI